MLSLRRYGWRFALGGEVAYLFCLASAYMPVRTGNGIELHRTLFETLPGFVWGSVTSVFVGVFYVFVFAWIFAAYFVWMHNTSLIAPETIGKADVTEPSRMRAA